MSQTNIGLVAKFIIIPAFSLEKKGILISYQSRPVCPFVRLSVTVLVNVPSPQSLDVATSKLIPVYVPYCRGYLSIFDVTFIKRSRSDG